MIAVVDYGMGNLRSVQKALESQGADARILSSPESIKEADKIVFPGVGSFGEAMNELRIRGLISAITGSIERGKPFLGLCLGLQLLFDASEEGGNTTGLGIVKGRVRRFDNSLKVPHMGWNGVKIKNQKSKIKIGGCPLFKGLDDEAYLYFVHSYYVEPEDENIVAARTEYGVDFVSAIWKDNIFATQFHPEKSQEVGLKILKNFVNI
ncbi:MAG: imidazole glycerol phosphate synthase subunit HisH [Candidatus Omnitrophica bacterium CG1_02_49_10]|nr:MAG: imidazole glycerol phosphate synthase subunit HisH [Candidatus Omnitrophica bacterium CG1_02_49_10]